jgi:hypothetical protein
MAITTEELGRVGAHISPDNLERLLLKTLAEMAPDALASDPRTELTVSESAALVDGGFSFDPIENNGTSDPIARAAATYTALLATSLSVAEAAALLGVQSSRIRQRLAARTLYGIKEPGGWRVPRFQFDGPTLLPGIARVLPRLIPGIHPVAVYNWFTTPNSDLVVDENEDIQVSPREWLRSGRSPQPVSDLASALGAGL